MRPVRAARVAVLVALALLAVACGSANDERDASSQPQGASLRVTLGTQEFPEGRVIGELWRQALAVNGYAVDLRTGVGPAEDLDEALRAGDVDGYVAYTGTVLSIVAGEGDEVSGLDPEETYERARAFYAGRDMAMSAMTPFENKDAVAVRADFTPVPLGEQYAALDADEVDAVDAFTTDPQLVDGDYVLLEDPELLFGSQNVVMTVSQDKLDSIDAEAFLTVVDRVNAALTEDAVVGMNAEVTDGRDETEVAADFLRQVGLAQPLDLS